MNKNVFTYDINNNKVFGVAAVDKLKYCFIRDFLNRVAQAFPKLTFEVYDISRVDVTDHYGATLGRVEVDFIGRNNRMVLWLWSPRMEDLRSNRTKTADLSKAVKLFAKYFRSDTDEELVHGRIDKLDNLTKGVYKRSLESLRGVLEEPLYNFFQTADQDQRYKMYSMLALPEEQLSAIETEALKYFESCALLDTSECAVILKTSTGYLVKRSTPEGIAAAPVERLEEVPSEYRAQIGLLKLASHRAFIPNIGIKLVQPQTAVESYLCINRQPV